MDRPRADPPTSEDLSFEAAYEQLEETVRRLEQGDLPIDELVALFERGMLLARTCNTRLDVAELRITQLAAEPGDEVEADPF